MVFARFGFSWNFRLSYPRLRQALFRCAKVSALLRLLHIAARISSADVSKRLRSAATFNTSADWQNSLTEAELPEGTSPIRAALYDILERFRLKQKFWIDLTFSYICIQMNTKCTLLRKQMSLTSGSEN